MKKLMFGVVTMAMVAAGVAGAGSAQRRPSALEVQQAVDARLLAMLIKVNAEKK